jgi:hypothetical protein
VRLGSCVLYLQGRGTHKICRHNLDISGEGELEKYYTVVSKIRTLTYRILAILPIKLGKVCQGLEAGPFEVQIMVFCF